MCGGEPLPNEIQIKVWVWKWSSRHKRMHSQAAQFCQQNLYEQLTVRLWGVFVRTVVVWTSIGAVGTFAVLRFHLSWNLALSNRLNKCTIVRAVLLGIGRGKCPDRLIKAFACSKVTRNHGWVA